MNEVKKLIIKTIDESYFTRIRFFLERAARKAHLMDYNLFITHFDKKIGPLLGASKNDAHIINTVIKVFENISGNEDMPNIEDNEEKLFKQEIKDEEFRQIILDSTDIQKNENPNYEIILAKDDKFVFGRYLQVESVNARGYEMFVLLFVSKKSRIETEKLNIAADYMREKLNAYYKFFLKDYEINNKELDKLFNKFTKMNYSPTKEDIIKEYYQL